MGTTNLFRSHTSCHCTKMLFLLVIAVIITIESSLSLITAFHNEFSTLRYCRSQSFSSKTTCFRSTSSNMMDISTGKEILDILQLETNDNKSYSILLKQGTGSQSNSTELEFQLRSIISRRKWDEAAIFLSSLKSFILGEGAGKSRTVLYVIVETCRKARQAEFIIPLLKHIPGYLLTDLLRKNHFNDDIMPFLSDAATAKGIHDSRFHGGMREFQDIVDFVRAHLASESSIITSRLLSMKAYSTIVKGYGRERNEQMLEKSLREIESRPAKNLTVDAVADVDVVLLNSAMDAYIRCGSPQKCVDLYRYSTTSVAEDETKSNFLSVWRCFKNRHIVPNTRTFNILLKAYREQATLRSHADYMALLQEMKKKDVFPDSITVNSLVDAYVSIGNISQAAAILNGLYDQRSGVLGGRLLPENAVGTSAGVEAYTSLIAGLAKQGDMHSAFEMLDLMVTRGLSPNTLTLTALMNSCMLSGRVGLSRAKELIKKEGNKYLGALTTLEQSALRGAYVMGLCRWFRNGHSGGVELLREAQEQLIDMARSNIAPDIATTNAFLQALCSLRRPMLAESILLLTNMVESNIVKPDEYTYSIILSALGKAGFAEQALNIFKSISYDAPASVEVVNALLAAFINGSSPLVAIDIFNLISAPRNETNSKQYRHRFQADRVTFTTLFVAMAKYIAGSFSLPTIHSPSANSYDALAKKTESMDTVVNQYIQRALVNRGVSSVRPASALASLANLLVLINSSLQIETTFDAPDIGEMQNNLTSSLRMADLDRTLRSLFYQMRYERRVQPDLLMLNVLNSLFAIQNKAFRNNDLFFDGGSSDESLSKVFSRDTARFVLEELIIAGYHPRQMLDILSSCGFSVRETDGYLNDDSIAVQELRSSSASYRIFKKHKWNKMNSGWTSFF